MTASSATQIIEAIGPGWQDSDRRGLLLGQTAVNGIDFVEFETVVQGGQTQFVLRVHFLLDIPRAAYGLPNNLGAFLIHGGTRIAGISVTNAQTQADPKVLDVYVDQQGDFSPYLLSIGWSKKDDAWIFDLPGIDRAFSVAPINFRPGCPVDFDCAPAGDCPPDVLTEPALDYMARDYASFRQLLIDLVAQRNPNWLERSPADMGIALLELFAYEGDHISYFQDAVSNEAYLDTARQRVSAKRHGRLVDYQMHDGRNAWTYTHFKVTTAGTIPAGSQLLTPVTSPLRYDHAPTGTVRPTDPPGVEINKIEDDEYLTDPALARVRVFETAAPLIVDPLNNELRIHNWGNDDSCLPRGATTAHVYTIDRAGLPTAKRPPLNKGDFLLLEEVLGPETGAPADADPARRQVVRIVRIEPDPNDLNFAAADARMHDPLFLSAINQATDAPIGTNVVVPVNLTLPLLQVTWSTVDALTAPFCLSTMSKDNKRLLKNVTFARGNIGLADHGRSLIEPQAIDPALSAKSTFRLHLKYGPLTMQAEAADDPLKTPTNFPPLRQSTTLKGEVKDARPAIALQATTPRGISRWIAVPELLNSRGNDRHFVVDVDDNGTGVLRFGDDEYGERFADVSQADIWYRIGTGSAGTIGADALHHIVKPVPLPLTWPTIEVVRNPLPAVGGADPELIEQVRLYAPTAFRTQQFRAVTEQDYKNMALTISDVAGAVASFRWTGSWYTVFVGIDPVDPANVLTNDRGVTTLEPKFKQHILDALTRYRLAGYDLEIRSARYMSLDIALQICARAGYFRGDVARAVAQALSSGMSGAGEPGFFNPARLTFGQPVYLSQIYAAVERVQGVESSTVTSFHRHDRLPAGELESGILPIGAWEIARLENSRSNMENGTLTITVGGGT